MGDTHPGHRDTLCWHTVLASLLNCRQPASDQDVTQLRHLPYRCTGKPFTGQSALYTKQTKTTLGPRAVKALYRGYTDATFTTPLRHDLKLGILGPLIQAQVRACGLKISLFAVLMQRFLPSPRY